MNVVLITLYSSTPCQQPFWKIQVPLEQAALISPRLTQITKNGDWYFLSEEISEENAKYESMDAKKFNDQFFSQFMPTNRVRKTLIELPVEDTQD